MSLIKWHKIILILVIEHSRLVMRMMFDSALENEMIAKESSDKKV